MAYTSSEQIRSHLSIESMTAQAIRDLPLVIDSNDELKFSVVGTQAGSVRVKTRRALTHTRATAILTNPLVFSNVPVVPDSVVVASNTSLGQIYVEPIDYILTPGLGQLRVVSGGQLQIGSGIAIWYLPYTLLTESADFHIDYDRSTIRRVNSGEIETGETIYVDFTPRVSSVVDSAIDSAVLAANGLIERLVDPGGQFEADPVLGLAATYTALEIVCRSAAARDLSFRTGEDRTAKTWLSLAGEYSARAESLISGFRPPITPLSSPTLS